LQPLTPKFGYKVCMRISTKRLSPHMLVPSQHGKAVLYGTTVRKKCVCVCVCVNARSGACVCRYRGVEERETIVGL